MNKEASARRKYPQHIYLTENVCLLNISKSLTKRWLSKTNELSQTTDLIRNFIEECIWPANKHLKKCSISFAILKMRSETQLRARTAEINKTDNMKCWHRCVGTRTKSIADGSIE